MTTTITLTLFALVAALLYAALNSVVLGHITDAIASLAGAL